MVRVHARAHLDLLLLAAVGSEPGDGAAVMRELRERSGRRFSLTAGTVYPALHRLVEIGSNFVQGLQDRHDVGLHGLGEQW